MRPVVLRTSSAALLVAAPACVVALHVVSPDLEPRSSRLSEYANGPYGYLMTLAFLTLGAGLMALAVALHDRRRRVWLPWPVPPGIAIAGTGMVVSGLFPTDPARRTRSARRSTARPPGWHRSRSSSARCSGWSWAGGALPRRWQPSPTAAWFAVVATVLAVASPWLHRSTWTGLSQRALWVALLCWLAAVTWSLRPSTAAHVSEDVRAVPAGAGTIDE